MSYVLMYWTVVAAGGVNEYNRVYDWRPLATFVAYVGAPAEPRCHEAARQLNLDAKRYRCVPT